MNLQNWYLNNYTLNQICEVTRYTFTNLVIGLNNYFLNQIRKFSL